MAVATVPGYDATHAGIASLPSGQAAGYSTGSGAVPWTSADWSAHPGAIRIDQSPVNTALDELCDILDVEIGAATFADCPGWAKAALANYTSGARPGQRSPAIYASLSNVTPVANALIAGGVTSGIGLWVANWNLTEPAARVLVSIGGIGPFPVIGCQYGTRGSYDVNVFSAPWLAAVSGAPPPVPPPAGWKYPPPASLAGTVTRAVTLSWPGAAPPAGEPAAGSYTVEVYKGTVLSRRLVVTGLTATVTGLSDGPHRARVWANGAPLAPAAAELSFTV